MPRTLGKDFIIGAIVPYQVTASTKIRVEYQLRGSDARTLQVTGAAPTSPVELTARDLAVSITGVPGATVGGRSAPHRPARGPRSQAARTD